MAPTTQAFRKAMARFATGVTVITVATDDGHAHGMTANAFTSVSLEPLLVLVCVNRRARTHALIHARGRFGVNVLAEGQQPIADHFARPDGDRESAHTTGARYRYTKSGTPLLEDCLAQLECRVTAAFEQGEHTVFIGQVEHVKARDGRPLLFYGGRYRKLEAD